MRKDGRSHDKKDPKDLVPKHIRDEQCRRAAQKAGRKLGSYNVLPLGAAQLMKRLEEKKFRVLPEYAEDKDVCQLSAMAQETVLLVMFGRGGRTKAPSRLKAAQTVLEQTQKPVIRESKVIGTVDLGAAVNEALGRKINK